jgi:hypothetical protein
MSKKTVVIKFEEIYQYFVEELRKTTNKLSQYNRSPGRDLNLEPPKYETGLQSIHQ